MLQQKNYKVTVEHCQKHINLAECKVILGVCYYSGLGVGENFEKSERLLKGAASEGHRLAKFNLSILFNAMGKYEDEYFWCNEAAEDGNASAKIRLQEIIKHGSGIPPYRYSEYISQLQEFAGIATEGNAQFKLGSHYHYGQFGLPIDHEQAKKWYERSIVNGNEDAMNNLGSLYEHSSQIEQNYQEAAKWYSEAVKKNPEHIQAVINLSNLYMSGKGVKQDLNEALRLLLTIVDTSADAKAALALLYGEGGLNDPEKAKMYQKEAAEGGSVAALSNLAKNATGEEALRYLNEAATAGDVNSQVQLAQRAMENIDYIDALYWTNHALQAGSTQAKDLLVTLGEHAETAMFA